MALHLKYRFHRLRALLRLRLPFLWRRSGLLATATILLGLVVAWWFLPEWLLAPYALAPKEKIAFANDFRRTCAPILGGFLVLIGLYLTYRRVEVTEEGQITERFTRAIDQLGSDKLEIRLGGIYALERIARDSEKDHRTIMEILTAYVREHARWTEDRKTAEIEQEWEVRPATDIQAILTVLGRRTYGKGENSSLDLSVTDLRGANLDNAHLERANLRGAHLEGASLIDTHLEHADLGDANLQNAILMFANLEWAILKKANLEGADLRMANLAWANVFETNLQKAMLYQAVLAAARLCGADLNEADLREAIMTGAILWGANLKGADLAGAHIGKADFTSMKELDYPEASGLTREQIESAVLDEDTRLPTYLQELANISSRPA